MRTFERRDKGAIWVWDIDLTGLHLTVIHGKRDKPGKVLRHEYATPKQADKEYSKRIHDKLRDGYVETTPPGAGPPANVRESLEQALAADPDDVGTHMAYADYLQEQGDPRGEFIQLQLALDDRSKPPDHTEPQRRRMLELLRHHQREWLGGLAAVLDTDPPGTVYFRRGWLDSVHIPFLNIQLTRALVHSPQVRLLWRLAIDECKWERTGGKPGADDLPRYQAYPATYVLARSPFLTNLRILRMGRLEDNPAGASTRYHSGPHLLEMLPRLLRLEELSLSAHDLESDKLFATPLPLTLRILRVNHLRTTDHALSLLRSGLLKQLKALQLNNAGLTDVAAGNIARCLPQPQLEKLDLSNNYLTFAGVATLDAAGRKGPGIRIDTFHQREPGQSANTNPNDDTFDDIME
jgi:uncharacterized protein (TIGR02996 family)